MRIRKQQRGRGVAMLLVLISLMTASVLSVAYVASRDNSSMIGENIASSAAARWGADTGVDLALAVLQTEADWRQLHSSGKVIEDFSVGDGTVNVTVTDLETSSYPTVRTEYVSIQSTAMVNGVEQVSTATAYVPSPFHQGADLDLSEFSIFSASQILLSNEAIVTRWPMAPLSVLGRPVAIATQATAAGSITISNTAAMIDAQIFAAPGSSVALVSSATGLSPEIVALTDALPMPAPPQTNVTDPADLTLAEKLLHLTLNIVGGTGLISVDTRVTDATLTSNATRTIRGPITFTSNDDLELQNSRIFIEGSVKLVVFDDLILQNSSIELRPGAKLLMYVGDAISMQDSYIGEYRGHNVRDNTGSSPPMNPDRIKIFRVPQYSSGANWVLSANSVLKASVYGKDVRFELKDQSALYGRVAANEVRLSEQGALFYDPGLNRRSGFTNPESDLYDTDGLLKPAVKMLASLDTASLQLLADAEGIVLKPATDEVTTVQPTGYSDAEPDLGVPSEPTPRPVHVTYQCTSRGSDIRTWERQ